MAIWKKAMDYLGLGPDDAYDDYDPSQETERPAKRSRDGDAARNTGEYEATVRTMPPRPSYPARAADPTARRPSPPPDDSSVQHRPINPKQSSSTRPAPVAPSG